MLLHENCLVPAITTLNGHISFLNLDSAKMVYYSVEMPHSTLIFVSFSELMVYSLNEVYSFGNSCTSDLISSHFSWSSEGM
jgi:hypothetical protein